AFSGKETNGLFVAAGDVNADGRADLIVGTDTGGKGLVQVFSGRVGSRLGGPIGFADGSGGVRVAAGDVNGDHRADIIAAAGPGTAPRVCVYDAVTRKEFFDFFGAEEHERMGLFVSAGDVNGDGRADILVGSDA